MMITRQEADCRGVSRHDLKRASSPKALWEGQHPRTESDADMHRSESVGLRRSRTGGHLRYLIPL